MRPAAQTGQVCSEDSVRMRQKDFAAQAEQMDLTEIRGEGAGKRRAHLSGRQGLCMRAFVCGERGAGRLDLSILFFRGTVRGVQEQSPPEN